MQFIGDVHGKHKEYLKLLTDNYSIQVGDFNFTYQDMPDPTKHKFIFGNHDNQDLVLDCPNCLGKYGVWKDIFYVSGGWSIDYKRRIPGVSWWPNEQLSVEDLINANYLYYSVKPDVVVSHEAPLSIVQYVTNSNFVKHFGFNDPVIKTRTALALQEMLDEHKPKLWIFGHYHKSWNKIINGTEFRCLSELESFIC